MVNVMSDGHGYFEDVMRAIADERARQDEKWGVNNYHDFAWLSILIEEIGEVGEAIQDEYFNNENPGCLEKELVQVAAVAVQWLECIRRNSED